MSKYDITETSPFKSDTRFPSNIYLKWGKIWGWNQNDKKEDIIICFGCVLEGEAILIHIHNI